MASGGDPIAVLVKQLSRLPGIGERTAQRLAHYLLNENRDLMRSLADALTHTAAKVHECPRCCNLTAQEGFCALCENPRRNQELLCVVARPEDLNAIEKSNEFSASTNGSIFFVGRIISACTYPMPETYISMSQSKSNVPPVSTENALILSSGIDRYFCFFPVSPCLSTNSMRLFVRTIISRMPLYEQVTVSPEIKTPSLIFRDSNGSGVKAVT